MSRSEALLSVSVAAQMAGMHAQTVRQYDRLGLVVASRTRGGGRRYSLRDVETLQEIQRLSQDEGINLAGIARIMELERELEKAKKENSRLKAAVLRLREALDEKLHRDSRVFAASQDGSIVSLSRGKRTRGTQPSTSRTLVLWRPR